MTPQRKYTLVAAAWLGLLATSALAQTPLTSAAPSAPTATQPAQAGSAACAPHPIQGGDAAAQNQTVGQSREPLSEKLARSDGVICPPAGVDPEIRTPAPDVGNTPVIPPPGSPGGDPSVRPE